MMDIPMEGMGTEKWKVTPLYRPVVSCNQSGTLQVSSEFR